MTFVERGGSARSFRGEGGKEHDLLPFIRANMLSKVTSRPMRRVQHANLGNTLAVDRYGGGYRGRESEPKP